MDAPDNISFYSCCTFDQEAQTPMLGGHWKRFYPQGVRDVIAVDELFDAIPAINRSFHHVKAVSKSDNPHGDDFIEFPEFRLFLQTLRQFFEYYEAFNR